MAYEKGEDRHSAKLTEEAVRVIRREYKPGRGNGGYRKFAERYDVSHVAIHKVVTGKSWKHLL